MIDLPKPVAAYFAAESANDVATQAQCFTEDAVVHDEDNDYHGRDAISRWKSAAQSKYQYRAEPLRSYGSGGTVVVVVRLTGNFPGSPLDVDQTFTITGDKISSLVIE
jgi:ketosteroid isomerase-like protein